MVMDMSRRGGNAEPPVWTYGEPPPSPARPPVRAPSPSPPPPPPSSDEAAALITALDACESTWREDQASVARPKAQAAGGVGTGGAEDADALGEAVLSCLVQRRLAVLAPRVDVCAELEQRRDALGVAAPVGVSVGLVG